MSSCPIQVQIIFVDKNNNKENSLANTMQHTKNICGGEIRVRVVRRDDCYAKDSFLQ